MRNKELSKALGKKSRHLKNENMIKVFLTIAKEPSSFSELLEKTGLSRPVLSNHLKFLDENLAIYPDIIKRNQTLNPQEIKKVVYRASVDEIPRMLRQALSVLNMLVEPLENKELDRELLKHKQAIAKTITNYLIQLNTNRALALKLDKENLKKELERKPSTTKES